MSHEYKVSLGQPKVNINQNIMGLPRANLWVIKIGPISIDINPESNATESDAFTPRGDNWCKVWDLCVSNDHF